MQHPTKQQVQTVIDTLYKAKERAQGNCPVDMMEGAIDNKHPCGTPMCHGGWYGLVKGYSRFTFGSQLMAKDLGFVDHFDLDSWANNNPEIWGNEHGEKMFYDGKAFGMDSDKGDLQQIINHWKGVQERLPV